MTRGQALDEANLHEKPKARMLICWGCSDGIRPGQPRVAGTEKMTIQEFGRALASRAPCEEKAPNPLDDVANAVNKLNGIFRF